MEALIHKTEVSTKVGLTRVGCRGFPQSHKSSHIIATTIITIYIVQTYSKIPKQLIQDNVNILVIFKKHEKISETYF